MSVTFTRKGRFVLSRDGQMISEHNVAEEAYENAFDHAEVYGDGVYRIDPPYREISMTKLYGILSPQNPLPVQPQNLHPVQVTDTFVDLAWDNAGDALTWQVYRDASPIGSPVSTPFFTDSTVADATPYEYQVLAQNAAGNSPLSAILPVTTAAQANPDVPTGLDPLSVTARVVSLGWNPAPDAAEWDVFRNLVYLGTVSVPAFIDDTVAPSSTYNYQILARNATGESALTTALVVNTAANSPAEWALGDQTGVIGVGSSLNLNSVCSDPDGHTLTFSIFSGSVPGMALVGANFNGTPTTAGPFAITYRANDGYDNSDTSITFTISDPDVTAPTAPVVGQATANGSTVTLPFTAGTDASGILNHEVWRASDGVNFSLIATITSASPYTNNSVPDGTWTYKMKARDNSANRNLSVFSNTTSVAVSVVPPAPDVAINLQGAPVSASQLNWSWAAGPNGAAPTDYDFNYSLVGPNVPGNPTANGPWTDIPIGLVTTLQQTGLSPAQQVWARVLAKNGVTPATSYAAATGTTLTAGSGNNPWIIQGPVGYVSAIRNARGPGMDTPGGSGRAAGQSNDPLIYFVDSIGNGNTGTIGTRDAKPYRHGTLRWCIGQHNAANSAGFILFEVSGSCNLQGSNLVVTKPYLHVAYHTAPSPGFMTYNGMIVSRQSHAVWQHLHARYKEGTPDTSDVMRIQSAGGTIVGVIVDHGTLMWGRDECLDMTIATTGTVTISNTILAEAMEGQPTGQWDPASIRKTNNVLFYGNLWMNAFERNPLCRANNSALVNGVHYNWEQRNIHFLDDGIGVAQKNSIVGNAFIRGPDYSGSVPVKTTATGPIAGSQMYLGGNKQWNGNTDLNTGQGQAAQNALFQNQAGSMALQTSAPYWPEGLIADTADNARLIIRTFVGARPADRDVDTTRLINEMINNTGFIRKTPASVNNPILAQNTRLLTGALAPPGPGLAGDGSTQLEHWNNDREDEVLP